MADETKELQIQVLAEISQIHNRALNLDQALEFIVGVLSRAFPLKYAGVAHKDPETGQLRYCTTQNPRAAERLRSGWRPGEELLGLILEAGEPFVVPLMGQEPRFLNHLRTGKYHKEQISLMGLPVIRQGAPVGVLSVDRIFPNEVPLEEDLRFLSILTALLAPFFQPERQQARLAEEWRTTGPAQGPEPLDSFSNFFIAGQSPASQEVLELIKKLAPGRGPLLLTGESGTGKSLLARMIHELSPRARYPFRKINCSLLPENLLAAELFGYEKDAVSLPVKARPGRLEEADGGSLFLEEIGGLSLNLQARRVRFLQEKEFQRLGSSRARKVDVRLIAATASDLAAAVQAGSFREDLYYLLSQAAVPIPALRERQPDIPLLLNHFLDKVSKEYDRRFYLTEKALEVLEDYSWPGNVREMENLVERLAIVVGGAEIGVNDLPPYLSPVRKTGALEDQAFLTRLKEMEKREILAALERNRWIQSQAAMDLGLTLRQIGYRVKQFGLEKLIKEQRVQARSG